ncbi:MAG TPA: PPA1309 family protein, partial [Actinomycetes bacterium]|nr:PPA1309 family protein [Actinomycetes bacterium]
ARDVEEFVSAAGWNQPPQLFALVRTGELLAAEPGIADRVDQSSPLTPIAQDAMPDEDLAVALAGITWPPAVAGCAASVYLHVLPPSAEADLPASPGPGEPDLLQRLAAEHPKRREARLVAAVLRDGPGACVLRLRGTADLPDEILEHPDLAPNLVEALRATFEP